MVKENVRVCEYVCVCVRVCVPLPYSLIPTVTNRSNIYVHACIYVPLFFLSADPLSPQSPVCSYIHVCIHICSPSPLLSPDLRSTESPVCNYIRVCMHICPLHLPVPESRIPQITNVLLYCTVCIKHVSFISLSQNP